MDAEHAHTHCVPFCELSLANLLVRSVQTTPECTPGEFVECTVLKCARVVYKVGIKSLHTPVQTPKSLKCSPPPSNVTCNPSDSIWGGNDDIGMNVTRSTSCFQTLCCHLCLTQKPEISTTSMEALRCVYTRVRAHTPAREQNGVSCVFVSPWAVWRWRSEEAEHFGPAHHQR